jgi:hypothetical protein
VDGIDTTMARSIASTFFLIALGLWAGAGVFFSGVVLPTLFLNLESSVAGQTAALLFPGYYSFGIAVGALLLCAACWLARGGARAWRVIVAAIVVAWACQLYAGFSIRPRMAELRGQATSAVEFQELHRLSVRLNAVVLIVTLGVLVSSASVLSKR